MFKPGDKIIGKSWVEMRAINEALHPDYEKIWANKIYTLELRRVDAGIHGARWKTKEDIYLGGEQAGVWESYFRLYAVTPSEIYLEILLNA